MQEDSAKFAINYLEKLGSSYVEARVQEINSQSFLLKNGILQASEIEKTSGIGTVSYTHLTLPTTPYV